MRNKHCILYFTLTPDSQSISKRLHHSHSANKLLTQRLYERTKSIIQNSQIDFIEINEKEQTGNDFGSKLSNSIQHVFNQGYDKVIVVGNDCVELGTNDLVTADLLLLESKFSIGKTKNGGVYLFSVSQSWFDADSFTVLQWCQNTLGKQLDEWLSVHCTVNRLRSKSDFNFSSDLESWLQSSRTYIRHILLSIITYFNIIEVSSYSVIEPVYIKFKALRAPPLFA